MSCKICTEITISNNTIKNNIDNGIYLYNCDGAETTISNNNITGNHGHGTWFINKISTIGYLYLKSLIFHLYFLKVEIYFFSPTIEAISKLSST